MIYKNEKGVQVLEFGAGDICVVCIGNKVESDLYGVGFLQTDAVAVGQYRPEFDGMCEDKFKPDVKMTFTSIKSIDVVMEHLQRVKESMLKENTK